MKKIKLFLFTALCFSFTNCFSQSEALKKSAQEGVLMYFMNEPYFFPITDTSLEKISKSNVLGLKLGKIDLNDILESISHKSDIVNYWAGNNNKIDSVKSKIGILLVKMQTRLTATKLSTDTAAFSFEYHPNTWGLFKYEVRFDTEVLSIEPLLSSDMEALKKHLRKAQ